MGVALVVTAYLLLDGRRTFHWLIAFVPAGSRRRALETAEGGRQVIVAYIRGNIITSASGSTRLVYPNLRGGIDVAAEFCMLKLLGSYALAKLLGFGLVGAIVIYALLSLFT